MVRTSEWVLLSILAKKWRAVEIAVLRRTLETEWIGQERGLYFKDFYTFKYKSDE